MNRTLPQLLDFDDDEPEAEGDSLAGADLFAPPSTANKSSNPLDGPSGSSSATPAGTHPFSTMMQTSSGCSAPLPSTRPLLLPPLLPPPSPPSTLPLPHLPATLAHPRPQFRKPPRLHRQQRQTTAHRRTTSRICCSRPGFLVPFAHPPCRSRRYVSLLRCDRRCSVYCTTSASTECGRMRLVAG